MKLLGIVVTYFPKADELIQNINTYIEEVDCLIIWENTPDKDILYKRDTIEKLYSGKIIFSGTGKNEGIGAALNFAAKHTLNNNFTHLLTLDQDSFFEAGMLSKFKQMISKLKKEDIGAYGVNYSSNSILAYKDNASHSLCVNECITSGTIYPTYLFKENIYFNEKMFIDAVDFEFCYRLKKKYSKKTIIITNIILQHELGYHDDTIFSRWVSSYSAFRTYYLIRNQLYIWRHYSDLYGNYRKYFFVKNYVVLRVLNILISEKDKKKKLESIYKGLKDGFKNKWE